MATGPSRSSDSRDDRTLVLAAATGDTSAFAAIYDRYADRLHDFCVGMLRDRDAAADCTQDVFVIAATKLVQLREPDRLRSWLYAIARSEALSRIRDRRRELPTEELPETATGEADMDTLAARTELADLISAASGGLSERDRLVLELAYRQGLDGPELAEALGVTNRNANTLVERLRETIARSLGALLVCRRVSADPTRCPELSAILDEWDGALTVLLRKRAARHIEDCPVCEEDRARMVTPAALLGATPVMVPAPKWLREKALERATLGARSAQVAESWWPSADLDVTDLPGEPVAVKPGRPAVRRTAIGAALLLIGALGIYRVAEPETPDVAPVSEFSITTTSPTPTTSTAVPATSGGPPPGPTTTFTTTTPSHLPRTAPPTGAMPVPEIDEQTSAPAEPEVTTTRGPSSFSPTPVPEQSQPEPEPEIEVPSDPPSTTMDLPPAKVTVEPPSQVSPPKKISPDDCAPDDDSCLPPAPFE
ncbi:RNA polymerase sigma factor [Mycolicibacterium sp. P9-22]|uniref:RNA polymerase sigma factor n=1 Tax=Mycolicibacterium sp. P9-22 TaxID=2024613 RepID=UPI001D14BE8C|nr:sigma-70 family RNA polymerase sigma factor [Mycolicibacterium sp. P9-22]